MNLLTYIHKLLGKAGKRHHREYVKEVVVSCDQDVAIGMRDENTDVSLKQPAVSQAVRTNEIIAFSHRVDLETYVKELNVPSEVIEGWISAGVLSPEETRVAAKMIRMIRTKRHLFDTAVQQDEKE